MKTTRIHTCIIQLWLIISSWWLAAVLSRSVSVKCFIILEKFEDTKGVRDLGVDRTVWGKISKLTRNKKKCHLASKHTQWLLIHWTFFAFMLKIQLFLNFRYKCWWAHMPRPTPMTRKVKSEAVNQGRTSNTGTKGKGQTINAQWSTKYYTKIKDWATRIPVKTMVSGRVAVPSPLMVSVVLL